VFQFQARGAAGVVIFGYHRLQSRGVSVSAFFDGAKLGRS
jgi:hypothetical protein